MSTHQPPLLTVITVVYNALPLLKTTIQSISSLRADVEHWIIDGGSTDGTVEWLGTHVRTSRVRWLSEPDLGIYDAMNKGLDRATGEYVWFLNAGDTPFSDDVLSQLQDKPLPDVIYGDTALIDSQGSIRKIAPAPKPLTVARMVGGMHVSHQSFIVRRELAPRYDLRYRHIADNKWVVDCLGRSTSARHVGTLSRYLTGGVSEQRYAEFWQEKIRFTFDELGARRALPYLLIDLAKAARFYASKWAHAWAVGR